MSGNGLKRAIIFSTIEEKKKVDAELKRISEITGFFTSKIIECILNHSLFPDSMNSQIWEVIEKYL